MANSLLILAQGPISPCVWFGTTVSVTLRPSLRGQGGAPATLLSGKEHTHKESEGDGERRWGSARREESVTRLQTKEERSLATGDEFQSLRGKVKRHWLCARWRRGPLGDRAPFILSVELFVAGNGVEIQVMGG